MVKVVMSMRSTREALEEQLCIKLRGIHPGLPAHLSQLLMKARNNNQVLQLLQSEDELENSLTQLLCKDEHADLRKELLGEQLFAAVREFESDPQICARITGMLLELDVNTVQELLGDERCLHRAIQKAQTELMKHLEGEGNKKQQIGETIYERIIKINPEHASKLTGMLLEMDVSSLEKLLNDEQLLSNKIKLALEALLQT